MKITANTCIKTLARSLINDVLNPDNFDEGSGGKGSFLTGGGIIICESQGLQDYLQKICVDEHGIWISLKFKPLAGFLMQCAYNLQDIKKDESENIFNQRNLVWAIYRLLEEPQKTFFFANELASLFMAYQIYRPKMIDNWNKGAQYKIKDADNNFIKNEKFQRDIWNNIKNSRNNERDIKELYDLFFENELKVFPKQVFIFNPISIAPVQLKALRNLSKAGCKITLYINQISNSYFGDTKGVKSAAFQRRKALEKGSVLNDEYFNFFDIGNKLIANMGKTAQILYEMADWNNLDNENDIQIKNTLLGRIQKNIFDDINETDSKDDKFIYEQSDDSVKMSSCFSPLREVEVLSDYLLELFLRSKESKADTEGLISPLSPEDIAVISPDIDVYSSAIETVFSRCKIPYSIEDCKLDKSDKALQFLKSLFSLIGSRYEAPDIFALFEYSLYFCGKEIDSGESEKLFKWIKENAIRHGLEKKETAPDYSFETGFNQAAAGFFMLSEDNFSEKNEYCYPDIEGRAAEILGDFIIFTDSLRIFAEKCKEPQTIDDWDGCFKECFKALLGTDETDYNEEEPNPYLKIIKAWDSLKNEMLTGFGDNGDEKIDFSVIRMALPGKIEDIKEASYKLSGKIVCSNIETHRAVPRKVICCIGMNNKEFPRQVRLREISLMADYETGDKDSPNEERLVFLETIISAQEKLYISWIGQDEKTKDELEPSSCVTMLVKYIQEQYGIDKNKLIAKHPLQPFSKKYFSGELETFDNRWTAPNPPQEGSSVFFGSNVWEWRIEKIKDEFKDENEIIDPDAVLKVLADAPKYFLKEICNIYLPEKEDLLDNIEPLVVEKGLNEWILRDLIINNKNYDKKIVISKLRGELPNGKFANELINRIIEDTEKLKKLAEEEEEPNRLIYPSNDKGKYRLKHWLYHLDLNSKKENQKSKMYLKNAAIELKGMSQKEAKNILGKIYNLINELETRLLPVFPDPAYEYIKLKDNDAERAITEANKKMFGDGYRDYYEANYSPYKKMALRNAESITDIYENAREDFIKCSEILFFDYKEYEIKGNNNE